MGAKGWGVTRENRRGTRGQLRQSPESHAFMRAQIDVYGVRVHPELLEWLMGWPLGWSAAEPLETARFRQWLDSHGICSFPDHH